MLVRNYNRKLGMEFQSGFSYNIPTDNLGYRNINDSHVSLIVSASTYIGQYLYNNTSLS